MKIFYFLVLTITCLFSMKCNYNITPLSFGAYDPENKDPTNSSSILSIVCSGKKPVSFKITCDAGLGHEASISTGRLMTHASKTTLKYNLFTDQLYVNILGDDISGKSIEGTTSDSGFKNNSANIPIFGRIFPFQEGPSGSYTDTIRITIVTH